MRSQERAFGRYRYEDWPNITWKKEYPIHNTYLLSRNNQKRTMYIFKKFYRKCLGTRWIHQCVIRTYSLAKTESGDLTTIYFQEDYFPGVTQIVKAFSSWLWILSFNKRLHYTCIHTNFPVSSREQFW